MVGGVLVGEGILEVPLEIANFSLVRERVFELLEIDEHKFYQGQKGFYSDFEHAQEDYLLQGHTRRVRKAYLENKPAIEAYFRDKSLDQITKSDVHVLLHD